METIPDQSLAVPPALRFGPKINFIDIQKRENLKNKPSMMSNCKDT